jgi:hypothetical protein
MAGAPCTVDSLSRSFCGSQPQRQKEENRAAMDYLAAFVICVLAATFEGLCAGRDPLAKLGTLRQPWSSPPNWLWVMIGIGWYAICFTALARLLSARPGNRVPVFCSRR